MGIVAVDAAELGNNSRKSERQAIAYRLGSVTMIGMHPEGADFLSLVDANGAPNKEGDRRGVVVRNGPGVNEVVIGIAPVESDWLIPLQTSVLRPNLAAMPEGLQRV